MANPIRKLLQNPTKLVGPHVKQGLTVLDVGCAMGFFTLPMARMVGASGRVVAVDLQEEMIAGLKKRAVRAGLARNIEARLCTADSLGVDDLREAVDFALAFAVVHEVPDPGRFFAEVFAALKAGGTLFLAEPKGHVSDDQFATTLVLAEQAGFTVLSRSRHYSGQGALLGKQGG